MIAVNQNIFLASIYVIGLVAVIVAYCYCNNMYKKYTDEALFGDGNFFVVLVYPLLFAAEIIFGVIVILKIIQIRLFEDNDRFY